MDERFHGKSSLTAAENWIGSDIPPRRKHFADQFENDEMSLPKELPMIPRTLLRFFALGNFPLPSTSPVSQVNRTILHLGGQKDAFCY